MARPTKPDVGPDDTTRAPRAFEATRAASSADPFAEPDAAAAESITGPRFRGMGPVARIAWTAGGILVSLALGLAAERLMADLFAANPWLGWAGVAVLATFVAAIAALGIREFLAARRLRVLDALRQRATTALETDRRSEGAAVVADLQRIYHPRPDLASARLMLDRDVRDLFDGGEMVRLAERTLMSPLDARARALTAGSARRVALVTAVSPRALIDVAFVAWESFQLAGAIARLYGARPGVIGSWRLFGAVLGHLAVTGGLALTDGVIEQLIGQGLAARLSHRLGEGLVNGLMTVRVGIAAMRVVRPLPFAALRQPQVKDFITELANVATKPAV